MKSIIHDLEEGPGDRDPGWGAIYSSDPAYDRLDYLDCAEHLGVTPI